MYATDLAFLSHLLQKSPQWKRVGDPSLALSFGVVFSKTTGRVLEAVTDVV